MVNKRVLVCVSNGVEETEAVIPINVLRKAGMEVVIADCSTSGRENELITGCERIRIMPERLLEKCATETWDLIVLPGGEKHVTTCQENTTLAGLLKRQVDERRWIAAICGGVSVLHHCKLLQNVRATTHTTQRENVKDIKWSEERVCVDRNIITSQAPGTAFEFALKMVEHLDTPNRCKQLAEDLRVRWTTNETKETTHRG